MQYGYIAPTSSNFDCLYGSGATATPAVPETVLIWEWVNGLTNIGWKAGAVEEIALHIAIGPIRLV
jgi:hypothetical protein